MRESVLDVLMYLFEAYIETQDIPEINHNDLKKDYFWMKKVKSVQKQI